MSDPTPTTDDASNQKSTHAHAAQRRVRWLSATGVCSGMLFFFIATALLDWHRDSRMQANAIVEQVDDAQSGMDRVSVIRNQEWTELLSGSPSPLEVSAGVPSNNWQQELAQVQSTFDSLNATLDLQGDQKLGIATETLKKWNDQAEHWRRRHSDLNAAAEKQFTELDVALDHLQQDADEQRGIHRLKIAVGLRSHLSKRPKPIDEILNDCSGSALLNQRSGDLKQLRLYLNQLIASFNVDHLADLSQNQIRPVLLRLKTSSEELGKSHEVEQVNDAIFGPAGSPGNQSTFDHSHWQDARSDIPPGILALQFALAESRSERQRLAESAAEQARLLDDQRNKLAMAGDQVKSQCIEKFANTLQTIWLANLGSGCILGMLFLFLTHKVSQDIAMQVDAIDRTATDLANEQLFLESVLSNLPIPLYWKDETGRYQGCSRSFAEWTGFCTEEDIVGYTDADLPWDDATQEHKIDLERSIMRYGIPIKNQEILQTRADGQPYVVLASKTPLYNNQNASVGLVGTYIDITERKTAEERLNGLAKIQSECPSEIYVFDMHTLELLELNHAACQNLMVDEEDYRGKSISNYLKESATGNLVELLRPIVEGDAVEVEYELTHLRTDGTCYPVHVRTLTIEHESEQAFVACATDMTLYKKLESKLLQAQKLESIGQLAAGIAHEINTPMQCICGNIDFLQNYSDRLLQIVDTFQGLLQKSPESWEHRIDTIAELLKKNRFDFIRSQFPMAIEETSTAAKRVVEIVRAMRVMSHPGSHSKSPTDINALIQDASILSRNRWKYAATVNLVLDAELPTIDARPAELSQVFLNLIINAADAIGDTPPSDTTELGQIRVVTTYDDANIYIELSDNGPGMSDEVQAKAFEPFFTTKEVGKGTGQGLSIAYDVITKLHGGTVDLQSEVGEGTLFTLCLPRQTDQEAPTSKGIAVAPATMPDMSPPAVIT
ncbi:PAS domain-containing sensor histidine kinase [Rhodopirellula sp. P2]|uniref:PAS domain-containing sensor histidine kinase n=1 Tax=Rhodopirellula sp. P2 TaxID=2127060 RepID=UPI002367F528|nr:ATP-binding protein [Rhodopirellula sp. P2]WDQ18658.1 ATP-binding protein [Rhodopirellula sp. P2]